MLIFAGSPANSHCTISIVEKHWGLVWFGLVRLGSVSSVAYCPIFNLPRDNSIQFYN